jgi:hypothetical protein
MFARKLDARSQLVGGKSTDIVVVTLAGGVPKQTDARMPIYRHLRIGGNFAREFIAIAGS